MSHTIKLCQPKKKSRTQTAQQTTQMQPEEMDERMKAANAHIEYGGHFQNRTKLIAKGRDKFSIPMATHRYLYLSILNVASIALPNFYASHTRQHNQRDDRNDAQNKESKIKKTHQLIYAYKQTSTNTDYIESKWNSFELMITNMNQFIENSFSTVQRACI